MQLYNSLTRSLEELEPLQKNRISLYVCGITPYDTTHVGHAFTYISFDVLVRYLSYKGYDVAYTQNVTDINDRDNDVLQRAKEQNTSWQDLSTYWTEKFLHDMEVLNWVKPTYYVKASDNIAPMIDLIEKILKKGCGYEKNGSVYLDVSKVKDFGKLSRFSKEEMVRAAKEFEEDVDNPDKKNQLDITLWRARTSNQPEHIPTFPSPYGAGRPGWHIECSAMSIQTLGEQIDIHGGGIDLIYPHHESEIAQSESATGKIPFAQFWLHNGIVSYQGKKMSKSLGNLVLVSNLLKNYSPNIIRWVLLSHHWRANWEFFEEELQKAEQTIDEITTLLKTNSHPSIDSLDDQQLKTFESFLESDLDTPKALGYIEKMVEKFKNEPSEQEKIKIQDSLVKMMSLLGFSNLNIGY